MFLKKKIANFKAPFTQNKVFSVSLDRKASIAMSKPQPPVFYPIMTTNSFYKLTNLKAKNL